MGILSRIEQSRLRNDSTYLDPEPWFRSWLTGDKTASGIRVSERTALSITDVWKCVRVRAESLAILPKKVYERTTIVGRPGRTEAPQHPLYPILHDAPNDMMTSFRFFEMGSAYLDTWGNWYSYIERGSLTGRVRALWPLQPDRVRIDRTTGQLWYYVLDYDGTEHKFFPDEILHIPGLGYDGIMGYSPIRLMMNAFGWAKATENYGAAFFGNGARPGGLLIAETKLDKDVRERLLKSFNEFHSGSENAGKVALIEGGLKWEGLTMPQNEAQFIETRKFQRSDIAGIYRLSPYEIGDPDPVSDNNVEHMGIQLVTRAILPPAKRCEQEMDRTLLSEVDRRRFYVEFEMKGLMRGDLAARTSHYQTMINAGVYSQNDVLQEENMPPFEGGDKHWIQLNMIPIEMAEEIISAKNQPQTAPPPADSPENTFLVELQSRVRRSYGRVFRDAIGRVLGRKNGDRKRITGAIFKPFLLALAEMFDKQQDNAFIDDYLDAMALRASAWTAEVAEKVVVEELDRAVTALLTAGPETEI